MDDPRTQDGQSDTSTTRRQMLRAAGGGLVLAASGLFLPDWLEEAEAKGGAASGALGGRRGKDRRGRANHERRTHGDRKGKRRDADKAPRGGLSRTGLLFTVYNRTDSEPMPVELHAPGRHDWYDWQYYPPERYVSMESPAEFETSAGEAILWIDNHYFVHAANAHFGNATVSLAYGGRIEKFGYWYGFTKVVDDYGLRPGQGTPEMSVDGFTFKVYRSYDDRSDPLEFFVDIDIT